MLPFYALFLFYSLVQAALVHWNHFTPFERESNLRAILWGARPAPRYWAVLALDTVAGLLLSLLVTSLLPRPPGASALEAWGRVVPVWILLSLGAAVLHHYLNGTVILFPRYREMARRLAFLALFAIAFAAGALSLAPLAAEPDLGLAARGWLGFLPAALISGALLLDLVFLARGAAFFLRVIPMVGEWLNASVSTGLTLWVAAQFGEWYSNSRGSLVLAGLEGLEPAAGLLTGTSLGLMVLAWRLPGSSANSDAIRPPPLVVETHDRVKPTVDFSADGATMRLEEVLVQVSRRPLRITVRDAKRGLLWETRPGGLTRDVFLFGIVALPLLYTGNTAKFKWRLGGRPFGEVQGMETKDDGLLVRFDGAEMRLEFHTPRHLRMTVQTQSTWYPSALSVTFFSRPGSHYLGLGQRFNRVDQRGQESYFLVEEGGVGYAGLAPVLKHIWGERGTWPNGEQCTGFPVPFCLWTNETGPSCGLFWNTYRPSWLSMDRPVGTTRLTVFSDSLDLYTCCGPEPLDAIRQYTALTGRSEAPPPWVLLPWKTRTGEVTQADALEDIHRFRELEIPLAHVGIEHWQEIRGSYEFSQKWYPDIDGVIREARARGYRITIWHFPYMNAGAATHREGVRRGYFLRNRLGLPYQQRIFHGIATVVDYTNPHASTWHQDIVRRAFYRRGFQGAMTDYAESVPPDCVAYDGSNGLELRNAYPVLYVQAMQKAAQAELGQDHLLYPRAGYAASQRYVTVQWPGDQDTDWDEGDGLPAAVRAMLNVSMCGFNVHGSDIGGWYDWFAPITTKELFLRWAEVGAFSPLMRAHGGPIGRNREPWKFDAETVEIYRALSEEHVRLLPYFYSLACQAAKTGAPIIRHPALIWPDRRELYEVEDAWLIGEALYVAPVIRPNRQERDLVLPPGDWWDLNANRPVRGPGRITVPAPYGKVPRFLRRGCILPRFIHAFDTFDAGTSARVGHLEDPLEVWLYPGTEDAEFVLFDGTRLSAREEGKKRVTSHPTRVVEWRLFEKGIHKQEEA